MKNKSDFGKALASAFAVSVVIKVIIAVFGFLTFGSKTDEAIVNNFPVGPLNITASISLVISSLLSIILCLRPVCESLDESTFFSEITTDISNTIRNIIIRVSLVVITLAIAIFLPHFALIAALMGSFQTVFSGFWIPLLVHLKVKYHELSRLRILCSYYTPGLYECVFCFGHLLLYKGSHSGRLEQVLEKRFPVFFALLTIVCSLGQPKRDKSLWQLISKTLMAINYTLGSAAGQLTNRETRVGAYSLP